VVARRIPADIRPTGPSSFPAERRRRLPGMVEEDRTKGRRA
jgi:hypothetical protein